MAFLETAVAIEEPDMIQKAGLIQFFEISYELAWKVLKDYMEDQGALDFRFPRDVIKEAFRMGMINDGHLWLKALSDRNLTSHTYNESIADEIVSEIRKVYFPMLKELHKKFNELR